MENLSNKKSLGLQKNSKRLISPQFISKYGANCPSFLVASADDSDTDNIAGTDSSKLDLTPDAKYENSKHSKKTRWVWTSEMCDRLIKFLHEYKIKTAFEGRGMEADLVRLYEDLRKEMAVIYPPDYFGPPTLTRSSEYPVSAEKSQSYDANIEKEKKQMKLGYLRIKEKVKKIRCTFKRAFLESSRLESSRTLSDNWDLLAVVWGSFPPASKTEGAIISQNIADVTIDEGKGDDDEDDDDDEVLENPKSQEVLASEEVNESAYPKKRPLCVDPSSESGKEDQAKKPTYNKRAKLQKPLSALQHDEVMVRVARDELELKKRTLDVFQQSSQNMMTLIGTMAQSMTVLGKQLEYGMALLAKALAAGNTHQDQHSQYPQSMSPQEQDPINMPPKPMDMPHGPPNTTTATTTTCISDLKSKLTDDKDN